MSPPRQVVVVLDVRGTLPDELIVPLLPPDRLSLEFVRLPEAVLNDVRAGSLSLQGLSHAVRDLVEETRRRAGSGVVEWYVCGLAPLPLFAQLGFELSAWAGLVVVLNRRKEGEWDAIPVNGGGAADSKFFARTAGMDACSYASGRLAVVVSVTGDEPNREAIRLFLEEHGETLAGIVELRSEGPKILDASNAGDAARELTDTFARLPSLYPNACNHGLAVFVAGPAPLAVLAGRAVNPNVIKGCWFPEHRAGTYVDLVSIPVRGRPSRTLDMSESSVTDRQRVKGLIQRALSVLQEKVTAEIVPGTGGVSANEFIATLRDLQVVEGPENGSFRLSILERSMSVGDGLLEALRQIPDTEAILIGRQLIIHELFHVWQDRKSVV